LRIEMPWGCQEPCLGDDPLASGDEDAAERCDEETT